MKWTFKTDENEEWSYGIYNTREEAIAAGTAYAKSEYSDRVYVAQAEEIPIESPIDADAIAEQAAEYIDDNYGGEYEPGNRFIEDLSREDIANLQKMLDDAFDKWVKERNIKCPCFTITGDTEEISLDESEHE